MQVTITDAANKFKVNPATIRAMCRERRVPSVNVPDSHHKKYGVWLVDTNALEAYWRKQVEKFQCKALLETDKAYIAGLLDGEGCFTAFITRKKSWHNRNGNKVNDNEHWQTIYYIQILVVEEKPIRWLKEVTGLGYLFQRKRQQRGWQDLWGWRVNNSPACSVVEQILLYLKIKRPHAEIFLQLRDRIASMKDCRKGKAYNAPMPEKEYYARQKLIDEIHRLNKPKGKIIRKEYNA